MLEIKLATCPYCQQVGALIGHGLLRGYSEHGSEIVVRGRRFFCSNRGRRAGCGRTFSVKLATVLCGFVVRTVTLWCFVTAVVVGGLTRRTAWRQTRWAFSLSTGYRLWRRLIAAQSALRNRLCRETPAPASTASEPIAQLVVHLALALGVGGGHVPGAADCFAAFQARFASGLFDAC